MDKIKDEIKIILTSLFLGLTLALCICFNICAQLNGVQRGVADEVLRLHIIANSDSEADQELKLKVRDAVLKEFSYALSETAEKQESVELIENNIDEIKALAERVVACEGKSLDVRVYLARESFPTKSYGFVTLPSGKYDALRIELGEAEGKNWWCVMFPPLCFVDATLSDKPNEQLKNSLDEEEYRLITSDESTVQFKIKLLEVLN